MPKQDFLDFARKVLAATVEKLLSFALFQIDNIFSRVGGCVFGASPCKRIKRHKTYPVKLGKMLPFRIFQIDNIFSRVGGADFMPKQGLLDFAQKVLAATVEKLLSFALFQIDNIFSTFGNSAVFLSAFQRLGAQPSFVRFSTFGVPAVFG